MLFSLTLVFLRWASNALLHTVIDYNPILQQGGAVLFGLMAGYLVAGFLVCVAQMLPANEHFLGFEPQIEANSAGEKPTPYPAPRSRLAGPDAPRQHRITRLG